MEYRDWNQDDVALVDNIPFILTYTENAYLAIPFSTGDNSSVFGNVAASTVVSPARILYLYYVENKQSLVELNESISYVMEYMRKKNFKAAVEFILLYQDAIAPFVTEDYEKGLIRLGNGRIGQVKQIAFSGIENVSEALTVYLRRRQTGKSLFALEKNTTTLSYMLQGAGLYKEFPFYQFDSFSMKFNDISGCEMLGFIKKTPYITVTDMAAFRLSTSESSNHPEFYADYKDLWKKYQEKSSAWKSLCDTLVPIPRKTISLLHSSGRPPETRRQINNDTPIFCLSPAVKVLLRSFGF